VEDYFPRVNPASEIDGQLSAVREKAVVVSDYVYLDVHLLALPPQALLERNAQLTPTPEEQTQLINLVSKVQIVLENLSISPGEFDACVS
jgi:hypothetical protein